MGRLRSVVPDVALAALGVGFGAGSLGYPFGRDQGLYHYVAREWVLRGSVPYRDVLDHKTPGIYVLHAIAVALFGPRMWGIRVLDFVCVILLGVFGAAIAYRRGEPIPRGVRGAGVICASVLYYGFLDFWNSAQSEPWYGMLGLGAIWAARRIGRDRVAAVATGLFAGAAMVMKPPAIWLVLLALGVLAARALEAPPAESTGSPVPRARRLAAAGALSALGGATAPGLVLAYFGAKGALPAMIDVVVGANGHYVKHERGVTTMADVGKRTWAYVATYSPLAAVCLAASLATLGVALYRRDRALAARYAIALAALAAGYAAVFMQGKFYLLHWTVVLAGASALAGNLLRSAVDLAEERLEGRRWFGIAAYLLLYAGLWSRCDGPEVAGPKVWWSGARGGFDYATGRISRAEYTDRFEIGVIGFWFTHSERVGTWLREHTTEDDYVAVRGFQPEIYAVANRRYPGRFFWTTFIVAPERAYKRDEWLAEDERALDAHPPKYVVTLTGVGGGPDSNAWFERRGYRVEVVMGELTILSGAPR